MTNFEFYYKLTYRRAKDETRIHWHRDDPPRLLTEAVKAGGHGRALDIGCGTGVNSVYMAQHGYSVTAVDFVPQALPFGIRRAEREGVKIEFVAADITKFETAGNFDLILDFGCFHGFNEKDRLLYRDKLLSWLAEGGQYVLGHFYRSDAFGIGPRGRKKEEIENFFAPELKLENFILETDGKAISQYRFRRGMLE